MSANEDESTSLSRRDFGKALGASAAIGAGATASSGTAAAADGLVDGVVSAIPGVSAKEAVAYGVASTNPFSMAVMAGLVGVSKLDGAINDAPSADQAILHNLCRSEFENLTQHENLFENRLTDAKPIASIEARHGIASSWENGDSASVAYDNAMSRIRQYYEVPEFNHYHVFAKSLLQLGYAGDAAVETGFDDFVADTGTDGSGNTVQLRFRANPTEVSVNLYDGTAIENVNSDEADDVTREDGSAKLKVPQIHLQDTTNGTDLGTVPALDQSVVDSWDAGNEEITFTADDGTQVTTDGVFVIPNVDDLDSARVLEYSMFFKLLDRIHEQSDTVTGNYSQSFVEDVYAELDAGNLTPSAVRSPEGIARFLSGTDDPTGPRFRMAMLQEFGMEQADFSRVATMTGSVTGSTGRWVDPDPSINERRVHPDDFVSDRSFTGSVFTDQTPTGGFQTEQSYLVDPSIHVVDGSGMLYSTDTTGQKQYQADTGAGLAYGVGTAPDGKTVYIGDDTGTLTAINATDGSTKWTNSNFDTRIVSTTVAPDGTIYVGDLSDTVYEIDPTDGSKTSFFTGEAATAHSYEFTSDYSQLLIGFGSGAVHLINREDATSQWSNSFGGGYSIDSLAVTSDDEKAVAVHGGGTAHAILMSDGSEDWTHSTPNTAGYQSVTISNDDSTVYVGESNNSSMFSLAVSDGTQNYQESFSGEIGALFNAGEPDKIYVGTASGDLVAFDHNTRSTLWTFSEVGSVEDISMMEPGGTDGIAGPSLVFDETTGDSGEELRISNAVLEITDMQDGDGNTVTHVTDQTITDLESLSETPDSIDTIVSDMDQFDSVEDIKYRKHVLDILEYYGAEGKIDQISTNEPDYQQPKYNSYNSTEYAEYMEQSLETYKKMLEQEQAVAPGGGGGFLDTVGNGVILGVVALIVGYGYLSN